MAGLFYNNNSTVVVTQTASLDYNLLKRHLLLLAEHMDYELQTLKGQSGPLRITFIFGITTILALKVKQTNYKASTPP